MTHQQRTISMESIGEDANRTPSWAAELSEERTQSRRRSLECTGIEIQIINAEITQDHTNYVIRVSSGIRTWMIKRRYKDFYFLDKQLRKNYPMLKFPALPPKRYLRSSNDPAIVEQRKQQLESYLSNIVAMYQVWNKNELVLFLNDESNLMSYIWNFERMRRLQDMLSMVKLENQTETEKLNSDLEKAQSQVRELQARLSQMEMIFLQQATGVGEQLPESVVRTLSGVNRNALSSQLVKELKSEHRSLYDDDEDVYFGDLKEKPEDSTSSALTSATALNTAANAGSPAKPHSTAVDLSSDDRLYVGGHLVEEMHPDELVKALHLAQGSDEISAESYAKRAKTPDEARTYAVSREIQEAIRLCNELLPESGDLANSSLADINNNINSNVNKFRRSNTSEIDYNRLSSQSKFSVSSSESFVENFQLDDVSSPWVKELMGKVDVVVTGLTPSVESVRARHDIFLYLRDLVSDTLGVQLFPIGSFVSRTFLPDGDLDATAFVPKLSDDSWYVKLNETLCLSALPKESDFLVRNVSFVSSEVKMIRSLINGVTADVSTNQLSSLYEEELIERVDAAVGSNHLFKRSLLLIKSWFQYESPRFTHGGGSLCQSKDGRVSTWTATVMLIWTFNHKGHCIRFPLQALAQFLRIFSTFDWCNWVLTVTGPVDFAMKKVALRLEEDEETVPPLFFDDKIFDVVAKPEDVSRSSGSKVAVEGSVSTDAAGDCQSPCVRVPDSADTDANAVVASTPADVASGLESGALVVGEKDTTESKQKYLPGVLNILDPFVEGKNLLEFVSMTGGETIVSALQEGYRTYQQLCEDCSKLLSFGQLSHQAMVEDVEKLTTQFFLNTMSHIELDVDQPPEAASVDVFSIPSKDLHFSIGYGQIALGGKIEAELLTRLITMILEKKGSMPVGEIGKNLQSLLGCESLSKRLKEQFSGLKRAIENSNNPRIRMGTEHPFNPIVALSSDDVEPPSGVTPSGEPSDASAGTEMVDALAFHHESFLFIPYTVQVRLQALAQKDAQSQQSKATKTYRRQPPQIPDSNSVSSHSYSTMSGVADNGARNRYGGFPYRGKHFPNSPGGRMHGNGPAGGAGYYRVLPQPIPIPPVPLNAQGHPLYPMAVDVNYMHMSPPTGPNGVVPAPIYPYPGVPIYPPPMGVPMAYPPHPYYPHSNGSSLSSSYQSSPLSVSPMNPSYFPSNMRPGEMPPGVPGQSHDGNCS